MPIGSLYALSVILRLRAIYKLIIKAINSLTLSLIHHSLGFWVLAEKANTLFSFKLPDPIDSLLLNMVRALLDNVVILIKDNDLMP